MDKLKPPHELKIAGGNLADRWERFLERFRWYLAAVGEDGSEDKKKVAIFYLYLNWQNVLGTHHASAHGGSSALIVKMLD